MRLLPTWMHFPPSRTPTWRARSSSSAMEDVTSTPLASATLRTYGEQQREWCRAGVRGRVRESKRSADAFGWMDKEETQGSAPIMQHICCM